MNSTKLIADRGHGLSRRQLEVLAAVARGEVSRKTLTNRPESRASGEERACTATVRSLLRLGLVAFGRRDEGADWQRWALTRDGYTLACRRGVNVDNVEVVEK